MTYDASNRKDIRAAEKASAEHRAQLTQFLRASMDIPQGRRWFWWLLETCQCFVDVPSFDPNRDYFSSGRRSVGLQLMADILTNCPDQYIQMSSEEHARIAAAERLRNPNPRGDDNRREGYSEPDSDSDSDAYGTYPGDDQ